MKLVLVRHGQSIYNLQNKFTGWKDIDLTNLGINEAIKAGQLLKKYNLTFDLAFSSLLKRAQETLSYILEEMDQQPKIQYDIALNERDYGDLIGKNKAEAADKFGPEQVQIWRRSYDVPPPGGESLKMTCNRTLPYFQTIFDLLMKGNNIIIGAHGNSLRAIVMKLFDYSSEQILKTEIGWCEPWLFTYDKKGSLVDFKILPIGDKSNSIVPFIPNFNK